MTKKISFRAKYAQLMKMIFLSKKCPDVTVMIDLGFSPSMWKVWRPKLIEYIEIQDGGFCMFSEEEEKDVYFKIKYIKKEKMWIREDYPVQITEQ